MSNSIMGISQITVQQCEEFLHKVNPNAPYLASIYKKYCDIYGIRLECAWVQMCLETNFLRYSDTSITTLDMNNFAGLGALDGNGRNQALKFDTQDNGVQCHIQHLYAYCCDLPLPKGEILIDPRFKYVTRGCAKNIENLGNGNWASDKSYANKLLNLLERLNKGGNEIMKIAVRRGHQRTGGDGCATGIVNEIDVADAYSKSLIQKLKSLGHEVLDVTPPEANRSLSDSLMYGINKANNWGADLFISCHVDAFKNTSSPMGCEVLYHGNSSKGKEYAEKVNAEFVKLGFKNRGAKVDTRGLAELNYTNMSAIICEPFFLDSVIDVGLYNKVGAEGIANAIVKGITGKSVGNSTSSNTNNNSPRLLMLTSPMMNGQDVKDVQTKLNKLGYKVDIDGWYGNASYNAILNFQSKNGLSADGIVGSGTLSAINSEITKLNQPKPSSTSQSSQIDHSIPDNPYVVWKSPNGLGYVESVPEKGRLIIHLDKYNYISVQDDGKEGNRIWVQTRTKGSKTIL